MCRFRSILQWSNQWIWYGKGMQQPLERKDAQKRCLFQWRDSPLVGQGLPTVEALRSHSDTPHLVGLLWMSDQPDAETSTWQHKTLARDRHQCPRQDSNSIIYNACPSTTHTEKVECAKENPNIRKLIQYESHKNGRYKQSRLSFLWGKSHLVGDIRQWQISQCEIRATALDHSTTNSNVAVTIPATPRVRVLCQYNCVSLRTQRT
jgi:hypothetical protein